MPDPGNIATFAAVSIPESECRLEGEGDMELGVITGVGVVEFGCVARDGCKELEVVSDEGTLQDSIPIVLAKYCWKIFL